MNKLTLLYDGKCIVCFKEVSHYLKLDNKKLIIPVDISQSDFDAKKYGLKDEDVNLHMHAISEDGTIHIGVDSFIEIWKRIPRYNFLVKAFSFRPIRPAIDLGYDIFAKHIRPRLPKRNCDNGQCSLT